jgi:hypothetical protein
MPSFTIAGHAFELDHDAVENAANAILPEPVREHYVVVAGRRFPPKQLVSSVTGLDRADFTTHQARRVLKRLGFVAARASTGESPPETGGDGPRGGAQAAVLRPFAGKWVALAGPVDVLVAADTPQDVLAWLAKHERRAEYGMFRVPAVDREVEGAGPL